MPKTKPSHSDSIRFFGDDVFESDGNVLFCKLCCKAFAEPRKFNISQHVSTKGHVEAIRRQNAAGSMSTQQLLLTVSNGVLKNNFHMRLCKAFMASDIPLHKFSHPELREFLETFTSMKVPDRSTLRRTYAPCIYRAIITRLCEELGDPKIWVSIDETTDSTERFVANVVVGKMERTGFGGSFLLACEALEATNATTICHVFVNTLGLLWDGKLHYDQVLISVTDAARYMKKAARGLKVLFPHLIHVTCVAHCLHRVYEQIRAKFPKVDRLIASMKIFLLKAPSRILLFKEKVDLPLPHKPIVTRWRNWLEAASYYAQNFETLKSFVCNELEECDAVSIK